MTQEPYVHVTKKKSDRRTYFTKELSVYMTKETCIHDKRALCIHDKRNLYT